MTVLQHYYTSFVNRETGSAGFQVKAMSPGISSDMQAAITRMIAYRIPPTLDEYKIKTHPIALRYFYKGPQECIFLCSQSNGTDENGRPGNFFAHSLVMEPDIFTSVPPILYWKSPFWKKEDPEVRRQVVSLPTSPDFDIEPTLGIDEVWAFLAQGKRLQQFEKLMSAVVHCHSTQRRIVIIDAVENIALWIAAVSCMLPSDYRPFLSFTTYHHDPYQAQFMIIGTTNDSSFRASPEEYASYFILNAEKGEVSNVDPSPYAKAVAASARSDLYETRLLPLFDHIQRFPQPTMIDEQLDLIILYAHLVAPHPPRDVTPDEIKAISIALGSFEQMRNYYAEDLNELRQLKTVLWHADQSQQDPAIITEQERVMAILSKHQVPTDEYILEELKHFSSLLFREGDQSYVISRIQRLRESYGNDLYQKSINSATYLQYLSQLIEGIAPPQLHLLWKLLCPDIEPNEKSKEMLLITLQTVGKLVKNQRIEDAEALLKRMTRAMRDRKGWLALAVQGRASLPAQTLEVFYYFLVSDMALEERFPYRNIVQPLYPAIIDYEIESDLEYAGREKGLATLKQWVEYARQQSYDVRAVLDQGLRALQKIYANHPQQWSDLTFDLLGSKMLAPLSTEREIYLVKQAMSNLSLSRFPTSHPELYEKYKDHSVLSDSTKTIIGGILAMQSGQLDPTLASRLAEYTKNLQPQQYEAEVKSFIPEFFRFPVSKESHALLLQAFFDWRQQEAFWSVYDTVFTDLLTNPAMAERAVDLFSFWLTMNLLKPRYIVQAFLFDLPGRLGGIRKIRGFSESTRSFTTRAARQSWYPVIQDFFTERRNVFSYLGQGVVQVQKRFTSQNAEKEAQGQEKEQEAARQFAAAIAPLFAPGKVAQAHADLIPKLYNPEQREQFWEHYWEQFIKLFTSRNGDIALDVLSFWFDASFAELGKGPYVVQSFFLGLNEALEQARKQRGFRETARQLDEKARANRQPQYPWYGLVRHAFTEQESGWFGMRRS